MWNMKDEFGDKFIQTPLMNSSATTPERLYSTSQPATAIHSPSSYDFGSSPFYEKADPNGGTKNLQRKSSSFAYRIREHVKLGPKLSETVKGKLRLGARIIQEGGRKNIFKQIFGVVEGEELLKASQCYLSTTAGPIAGLLFISTHKVAFCSERCISFSSPDGQIFTYPYKVLIPVRKIREANQSENVNNPAQKYIEIVTEDDFEFWFMGFIRFEKAVTNLQSAISMANQM